MRRFAFVLMLILCPLMIVSCAQSYRGNPYPQTDLTAETWQRSVDTSSANWAKGADRWFLTGDPSVTEIQNMNAGSTQAISTVKVEVPQFTNIKVNAPFQVQIFAADMHNSVYVYGPNQQIQNVAINVRGNTLYIDTAKNMPGGSQTKNVIIRVGIVNLRCLENQGAGRIEGRLIHSDSLKIISKGSGNIYLSGPVNLQLVKLSGAGCVSVFGAVAPVLDIMTTGTGTVNVSGNIGVRTIRHTNRGDINLVGVNSDGVRVLAYGTGKIGLYGRMNLCDVTARDNTQVFAMYVNGSKLNVYASGSACVGIAGTTGDFYVDAADNARVFGRYLCSDNAYAKASYHGHINVSARSKVYASALESSSIYFFGKPTALSQFVRQNGTVMPVWADAGRECFAPAMAPVRARTIDNYKDMPAKVTPLNSRSVSSEAAYSRFEKVTPLYSRSGVSAAAAPEANYTFRRKRRVTSYTADM